MRGVLNAWFPALVSLGSLWVLASPGLAYFQVQQALLNTLGGDGDTARWISTATAIASIALLAITLSAWSTRLIPNFYRNGQRADASLLLLVLFIGMGPVLGFALCVMGIASLPDVDPQLQSNALEVAAAVFTAGILSQVLYYWLSLHPHRRQSRNVLRYFPLALYLVLLLIFTWDSAETVAFARALGPVALFAAALSFIVAACSFLISVGRRTKIPLFGLLLFWIVLLNYYDLNDGHPLTRSGKEDDSLSDQIDWAYHKWAGLRSVTDPKTAPVILVSSEGGGIRAAYVTGIMLAAIADRCPVAANRIFAISSVSGGSVGAAAYVAAVHDHPIALDDSRCDFADTSHNFFQTRVRKLLAADHLSGLFSKALFTEPVQAVLPFPIVAFDRQRGLNESIRTDWRSLFSGNAIDRDVLDVIPSQTSASTPYLVMNTTNIEHGARVTMGAMRITGARAENVSSISERGLSLIEAATTSARFPFVSPPGFLLSYDNEKLRYTDGGVYDNSGTLTASDIYDELATMRDGNEAEGMEPDPSLPSEMPILVLNITNTTTCWEAINNRWPCARPQSKPTLHAITDTISGLFAARDAHTDLFKEKFYREISAEDYRRGIKGYLLEKLPGGGLNFVNDEERKLEGRADTMITMTLHSDISVPLGWMLSKRTAAQMDQQLFEKVKGSCLASWSPLGYVHRVEGDTLPSLSNGCAVAVFLDYFDPKGFQLRQEPVIGF